MMNEPAAVNLEQYVWGLFTGSSASVNHAAWGEPLSEDIFIQAQNFTKILCNARAVFRAAR